MPEEPLDENFATDSYYKDHKVPMSAYPIAMAVGLVSISIFFIALAVVYFITLQRQTEWKKVDIPLLLWVSTALIAASSYVFEKSRQALKRGRVEEYRKQVRLTAMLGGAFLVSQMLAWVNLISQGVYVESNPHGSMFYMFTGAHGVHLLGGVICLGFLVRRSRRLRPDWEADLRRHRNLANTVALYWHFMGVLWALLFLLLYLWS